MSGKLAAASAAVGAALVTSGPLAFVFGVFALGYFIGHRRGRADVIDASRQLATAPAKISGEAAFAGWPANVPRPLEVLCGFLRAEQDPPLVVVHHAVAEAELLGDHKLAHDLEHTFVPVGQRRAAMIQNADVVIGPSRQSPPITPVQPPMPPPGVPAPVIEQDPSMQGADPNAAPSSATVSGEVFARAVGSPLPGVPDDAWMLYAHMLARQPHTFADDRRVGRYAQRKERLRELGCDPDALVSHPRAVELQERALAIDAIDSAKHLEADGSLAQYVGKPVKVPGEPAPRMITLSGMLGVAQTAGLEGAIDWLEHDENRTRFPKTTEMFVRCNGVF
jgi:hypothetical protein